LKCRKGQEKNSLIETGAVLKSIEFKQYRPYGASLIETGAVLK